MNEPADLSDMFRAVAAVQAEEQRGDARAWAPFAELADRWENMLATESEIMTTAQRNAWRDALAELRRALGAGSAVPAAAPARQEFCGTQPGHPPHGNCGGYPPSPAVATPTEPGRQLHVMAAHKLEDCLFPPGCWYEPHRSGQRVPAEPQPAGPDAAEVGWQAVAAQAVEALRLTREYVEPRVRLPALPGWSWFDATNAYLVAAGEPPLPPEPVEDRRPHSRACGIREHRHGPNCAIDCPTCSVGKHQ